jgi:DNA-binding ferritin-like protein
MNGELLKYMESYLANLKASILWFHAAHHVTKGQGFISDHKSLYGEIYSQMDDHFDELIEKSIALSGEESIACPLKLSLFASHFLNKHYTSPVDNTSQGIVESGIEVISNLINSVSDLYETFEASGMLTLGLDDTLSSHANQYEKYLYFLGQRFKS